MTAHLATETALPDATWSLAKAFGTEYVHVKTSDGGDMWLTHWGLPWREHLDPERWYANGAYVTEGTRLPNSTGHVYKLAVTLGTRKLSFVVKLSRVGQRVSSGGLLTEDDGEQRTSFASPFEEIGQLMRLRSSDAPRRYLFSKRPLAVFSPEARVPAWMMDRVPHEFSLAARRLAADAARNAEQDVVRVEGDRDYFTLFGWIHGYNLKELVQTGQMSLEESRKIDDEVRMRMRSAGFAVADHKPDHIIVRLDAAGAPMRRHGKLVAALADFELLEELRSEHQKPEDRSHVRPTAAPNRHPASP